MGRFLILRSWIPFIILLIIWGTMFNRALHLPLHGWQWFTMLSALIYTLAIAYLCFTPTQYNWGGPHKIFYHVLGVPCNAIPFQALSPDFFLNIVMTVPAGIYWYLLSAAWSQVGIAVWHLTGNLNRKHAIFMRSVFPCWTLRRYWWRHHECSWRLSRFLYHGAFKSDCLGWLDRATIDKIC